MYENTHHRTLPAISLVYIAAAVSLIVVIGYMNRPKQSLSPIPDDPKRGIFETFFLKKKDSEDLKKRVQSVIGSQLINYSVIVTDLRSDFRMAINDRSIHTAASVNKIPILAALYYQAQKGEVDLDHVITVQADDMQDYGTGVIRYQDPGVAYSVKSLALLMMKKSDNTAAYILANQVIGMNTIQALLVAWGMDQTDMENNKTSAKDMEKLMKKIYEEKVANHAFTLDMFSTMKDSDYEDRLPALIPKSVDVYHKIGNGAGVLHDVGVVIAPTTEYFIAVMASDVRDEKNATSLIAQVSKTVYDFMK
jgi:beta-lactamase class A